MDKIAAASMNSFIHSLARQRGRELNEPKRQNYKISLRTKLASL